MKYPKEMIFKLKNDNEFSIKLINTMFDNRLNLFRSTIEISKEFVDAELNKNVIELITEEK